MTSLTALHPYLRTKKDANSMVVFLDKLLDGLFSEGSLENTLTKEVPYDLKKGFEMMLKTKSINIQNKTEMEKVLRELKEEISNLPIVHIILAFPPSEDILKRIQDWFYENYKKTVLIETSVDESQIGGSVISFGGRAQDYSIKTRMEQMAK